jgi:hypothetical protein
MHVHFVISMVNAALSLQSIEGEMEETKKKTSNWPMASECHVPGSPVQYDFWWLLNLDLLQWIIKNPAAENKTILGQAPIPTIGVMGWVFKCLQPTLPAERRELWSMRAGAKFSGRSGSQRGSEELSVEAVGVHMVKLEWTPIIIRFVLLPKD